jgi:D-alanine--poly(phosphoribitol) ligase subunit 2
MLDSDPGGTFRARTLAILRDVVGDDEVTRDPDLPLLDSGLLDSLAIVTLMVAFQEAFGLVVSPANFDRRAWSTVGALLADVERRLIAAGAV